MGTYVLHEIDLEDIDDVIFKLEPSFHINFGEDDLHTVYTMGDLIDLVFKKILLENKNDCTTQQAFYKLRNTIVESFGFSKKELTPKTKLIDVLPKKNRKAWFKQIESKLGFPVNVLQPKGFIVNSLLLILLASVLLIFLNWKIGLLGLVISIISLDIIYKLSNELGSETLGDLAKKISREHYLLVRRNQNSFNPKEIEPIIFDLFEKELDLDKSKLNRSSKFVFNS